MVWGQVSPALLGGKEVFVALALEVRSEFPMGIDSKQSPLGFCWEEPIPSRV